MVDFHPGVAQPAMACGLLRQGEICTTVRNRSCDEYDTIEAEWDADSRSYRYFSMPGRWTTVPEEDLQTYDLDMDGFLAWIARQFGQTRCHNFKEVVPGILWDLGVCWVGKRRISLFFLCRVSFSSVYDQVYDALRDRSVSPAGILLTTSQWSVRNATFPGNHRVVRLEDCLLDADTVAIDMDKVANIVNGTEPSQHSGPLQYSSDYGSVTVHGRTFVFRGDKQKQVIGMLIEAWERGDKKVRSQDVLEAVESRTDQIRRLFRGHSDWSDLIGYQDGFCWLKVV
ncbi:MAG: hypothetical protein HQL58_13405 [Magnetococcales bacterium]|nr:hypothetical protein [Magnetococcales bacterium]